MTTIAEGTTPDLHDELLSLHWDAKEAKLIGLFVPGEGALTMHSLDPSGDGAWDDAKELEDVPSEWNTVGGNSATISVFDADARLLYFMAGTQKFGRINYDLAAVDVDAAAVKAHPPLAAVGMAGCKTCVAALTA
mmetsp:Transcript_5204/g.15457  ORF Transcript_5204/g.15457 Transcript_5204/m.15457 type:complete len:135 (+) Transcript_5204:501-905(+)|eukprot:CAMPEP_0119267172 /NCGR_PEP_ID=MMETSP1329-20130426/5419_1 /TAXON_ID=114041 /ORGANISM="Genus nov. species nov., Strain RCC1024" /LENGTH=134 /DNA_ID=CAMNT_0007267085 /DNA_START=129 /DNA_END=533 /DNA_ORIENTATION=+